MTTRIVIFAILAILLIASVYKVSCEQDKAAKMNVLSATRRELGDVEQAVMECNLAVTLIEDEIAKLRNLVVEKKATKLQVCKDKFDKKIRIYKAIYRAAHETEASEAHIDEMKRRLGIII